MIRNPRRERPPRPEPEDGAMQQFGDDLDDDEDGWECSWCGGTGLQENDDPLWHGFDVEEVPCAACRGSGRGKDQTLF